jgi:DNA-binding transcriptional LysR family regulator
MTTSMPTATHIGNYHLVRYPFETDMPISHRQVELFRAIVQAGSLGAAAQALHSSQPTLSRELALMEQRLGYRLFERRAGSRLQATAAAQALFDTVQRHYQGLAEVQAHARALQRQDAEQLQVLALPALAHALLPAALADFLHAQPEARVAITPAESPQLEAWMADQRFDLAVSEARGPLGGPLSGCQVEALAELAEVAVLPSGHPLLAQAVLAPNDFAGQPFISLADDDPYRAAIDAAFAGVPRQLRLQTHSAVAACALVAEGLGLAVVNPLTALAVVGEQPGRLHWRPLSVVIRYELNLIQPLQRPPARGAPQLAQALRDAVTQRAAQSRAGSVI